MKSISIRMSEELLESLREMAAKETIKRKKYVSINTLVVEVLTQAAKKGG